MTEQSSERKELAFGRKEAMNDKDAMPITPKEYDVLAREAARYRYLRANWDNWTGVTWRDPAAKLDEAVDAAMAADSTKPPSDLPSEGSV
jgi:broad specificity phosphatase PhoE